MSMLCLVMTNYEPFKRKGTPLGCFISLVESCQYEEHNKSSTELDQQSVGLLRTSQPPSLRETLQKKLNRLATISCASHATQS